MRPSGFRVEFLFFFFFLYSGAQNLNFFGPQLLRDFFFFFENISKKKLFLSCLGNFIFSNFSFFCLESNSSLTQSVSWTASMLRLLTTISFHCMCSLKRTGPLCWTWVTGVCGETRVLPGVFRASLCTYPLVGWLVCRLSKRRMMNTQHWSRVGKFRVAGALVYGWCSCEDRRGEGYHVNSSLLPPLFAKLHSQP